MTALLSKPRIRASESAIEKAIRAAQSCGLSVESMLISGGKVELKLGGVDAPQEPKHGDGLKDWNQ